MVRKKKRRLFVIDLETGGLNPRTNGICSISIKEFGKRNKMELYIKPVRHLDYEQEAMNINLLTKKYLRENGLTEKQAFARIRAFIGTEKVELIGYNTQFDYNFLKEMVQERLGFKMDKYFSYGLRDVKAIAMFFKDCKYFDFKEGMSLVAVYKEIFGKDYKNPHNSMSDVLATEKLYKEFLKI